MEGEVRLATDGDQTLDGLDRYKHLPSPIKAVEMRYCIARCVKCHEDHSPLKRRTGISVEKGASDLANTNTAVVEGRITDSMRETFSTQ